VDQWRQADVQPSRFVRFSVARPMVGLVMEVALASRCSWSSGLSCFC